MMTVQIRTVATQAAGVAKNAPLDVRRALQTMIDKKAKEQQDSAKVTLSEFGKLQARMLQVRQSMNSIGEARKSAARAHAAQLRQQIEGLKKIAVMLGPVAAKTLLRQIKHLAQQVRQIAAELAQSSSTVGNPGAMTGNVGDAALNGDLSVDANVDFGTNAETENGEWTSAADTERAVAAARTETSAGETVEEEGDESEDEGDKSVAAQAEQAAQSAEREIRALEEQEDEKNGKTTGIDGSSGFAVNSRDEARQKQEDVLLVRDLVKELRLLLSLVKGILLKKDKEDKDNLKEIEENLADIDDLAQELEDAAESATDAEAAMAAEIPTVAAVDAAVGDAAVSISVFAR